MLSLTDIPATQSRTEPRLVLVTGPSGAGRSTAIKAMEDLGFEAIDNLPLSLLPRLLDGPPHGRPLALGLDVRNRDFSTAALLDLVGELQRRPDIAVDLLYLDCRPEVLLRRFSETRRRHPMAPAETPEIGVDRELDLLGPVRERADILIDTSEMTPHELRAELGRWFDPERDATLALSLHSFSFKRGLPRGLDTLFDVRFLRNPYWEPTLRPFDGRDERVAQHVAQDPLFRSFFERLSELLAVLLPAYRAEGKSHLTVGFGCTGGQHRSVAVTEALANALAGQGWQVSIKHWELERRDRLARFGNQGDRA